MFTTHFKYLPHILNIWHTFKIFDKHFRYLTHILNILHTSKYLPFHCKCKIIRYTFCSFHYQIIPPMPMQNSQRHILAIAPTNARFPCTFQAFEMHYRQIEMQHIRTPLHAVLHIWIICTCTACHHIMQYCNTCSLPAVFWHCHICASTPPIAQLLHSLKVIVSRKLVWTPLSTCRQYHHQFPLNPRCNHPK